MLHALGLGGPFGRFWRKCAIREGKEQFPPYTELPGMFRILIDLANHHSPYTERNIPINNIQHRLYSFRPKKEQSCPRVNKTISRGQESGDQEFVESYSEKKWLEVLLFLIIWLRKEPCLCNNILAKCL